MRYSTKIEKCRSCSAAGLEKILNLGNFYLSNFLSTNKVSKSYPLALVLCKKCFLLQLQHTTHSSILYTENYGYKSGINYTMREELREITEKSLRKINHKHKKIVCLDIGANDGTLLKNYPKNVFKVGVEPIRKLAAECKKNADAVINDFFNYKAYKKLLGDKKASIITAISCFYDIEDPNQFILDITRTLDEDGIFVIQQNYLKSMLELNAFDNIVHEHLEYYSILSLNNLLSKYNLEIFNVETSNINGGSFRTYISFKNKRKVDRSVSKLLENEKKIGLDKKATYLKFAERIKKNSKILKDFIIKQVKKNKKIYAYGASTRGNTLLQYYKLDKKLITAAVERNPEKWGKKIASVGIPVISEKQARKENPDYMLILPWFFKEEFLQREKAYLKSGGHFIFPLPSLEVV
ncbi:MAG: class I SAM-dependent methyltransferase [Candidatus Parcubacteria bacterium]|nr:class I SAM-dependent methyltransferase [Candidatus Parcubacteria bacterium]